VSKALLALVVALAACVQATAGMGFALILSPVLLVVLAPTTGSAVASAACCAVMRSAAACTHGSPGAAALADHPHQRDQRDPVRAD
jgi:uncharacterized membrane protein YfcA